ncbi:MAG: outer membrane protein assembly factor BamD [Bacteriovoracia bacterium]
MLKNKRNLLILLGVLLAAFAHGCSGKEVKEDDPNALYTAAEEDIEDSRYELALEKLRMVKNRFPYSNLSQKAQLRIADVYFLQENFVEAASSYDLFKDLHPKHASVPYAMYRAGEAYYQDIPGNIARDLGSAQKSLDSFSAFLRRFPADAKAPDAQGRANEVRRILASKEEYIGNFYYRNDNWLSAQKRYRKLIELYPETESAKNVQEKLKKAEEMAKKESG